MSRLEIPPQVGERHLRSFELKSMFEAPKEELLARIAELERQAWAEERCRIAA